MVLAVMHSVCICLVLVCVLLDDILQLVEAVYVQKLCSVIYTVSNYGC